MMQPEILTEEMLRPLVERFYDRVRKDPGLEPVFSAAITNWAEHKTHLADFWSSVMLGSGRYTGYPVALHLRHAAKLTPELFGRWLSLWRTTTAEMLPDAIAGSMQAKASKIAQSLQFAIIHQRPIAASQNNIGTAS
jgi:hemoglobin